MWKKSLFVEIHTKDINTLCGQSEVVNVLVYKVTTMLKRQSLNAVVHKSPVPGGLGDKIFVL